MNAIAQSSDGYLWIGTDSGLVRFDGSRFQFLDRKTAPPLPSGRVLGVLADNENNLWIRFASEGLFRYRNGVIADVLAGHSDLVEAMHLRANGTPVFQTVRSASMAYLNGAITTMPLAVRTGAIVTAIADTADGTLWYGTRDDGLYYLRRPTEGILPTALRSARINCLLPISATELWLGIDKGVAHWTGKGVDSDGVPAALARIEALSMIRDRHSAIWISTAKGLIRVVSGAVTALESRDGAQHSVNVVFEDREGNIWFGGPQGLERLRERPFVTYSNISQPENTPEDTGPLWAGVDARVWYAPSTGGLYWRRNGTVQHIPSGELDRDVIYSISGNANELWLGRQKGGLTRVSALDSQSMRTYTAEDGLARGSVYCVYQDRDGAVWAGTTGAGVSRWKDGRFQTFNKGSGLPSNAVSAIEQGQDGTMWIATDAGLGAYSNGQWRRYSTSDGLPPYGIVSLAADRDIMWIGTTGGLVIMRNGRVTALTDAPSILHESIVGIAMAPARQGVPDTVWIATERNVMRVNRDRLLSTNITPEDLRIFAVGDGLRGTANIKRFRGVITDPSGKIWFSTNRGLAVADPAELAARTLPTAAHIQSVSADEASLAVGDAIEGTLAVAVPAAPHRVMLGFIGSSLAEPTHVLFRYRLDGYDTAWSDPTTERQATYTKLGPGDFRFHVMARNADGAWDGEEAAITVSVAPLFWQTRWFLGACLFVLGAGGIAAYRLRMHQLTAELNVRFEERLRERNRIAQELHDTLLQGFLGAAMKLEVAIDRIPEGSSARPACESVLALMRRVVDEGRNTVRGLRPSDTAPECLEEVFSRIPDELGTGEGTEFRVLVEGAPRRLNDALRDEAYRIGREAVVNALRHSGGKKIVVELEYADDQFSLRVRDNGIGIDPDVLRDGRDGHWGLQGIRERAERAGGRLTLWSSAAAGTEIVLAVPRNIAYASAARKPEKGGKKS